MLIAAAALVAVLVIWGIIIFNRFIRSRNLIREAWSGIDVQLRRRYDLVPAIVESVKGYSKHERSLFEEVARLRTRCIDATGTREQGEAEKELSNTIKSLFAVAEEYPDLKASRSFLNLQKNLMEIEDQIQLARRYYNGTVRNFNIMVESFPSMLVARSCGFTPADFFEIEYATEREAPEIELHPR